MSIGEEYRGKLSVGARAMITVEAIPGLAIEGQVKKIESLARNRIPWDESSPKVFETTLLPTRHDDRMISGMTTRIEIVAEVVPNVLQVPLEAVFNDDGEPVCYVRKGAGSEKRSVQPGKSNDHSVEITSGLAEGEQVDLTPARAASASGNGKNGQKGPKRFSTTLPTTLPTTMPTTQASTTRPTTQEATR